MPCSDNHIWFIGLCLLCHNFLKHGIPQHKFIQFSVSPREVINKNLFCEN